MISRPFVTALSVFALSVFALLLNGCSQAPAIKRAPIISEPSVTIDRTKLGDVMRTILVTGSLMAFEDISLSAKQGGRISEVLVREGDKVKAGQVLAKVDPADLISQVESDEAAVVSDRAKVAQSQAAYDQQVSDTEAGIVSAKAALDQQLATANAQVRSAELAVASAKESLSTSLEGARPEERVETEASLASARASFEKSASDLNRYSRLHQAGAISDADFDQYVSSRNVALANLNSAEAALKLQQEGNRRQDIARAKETVREEEETLRQQIAARATNEVKRADLVTALATKKQNQVKFADILAAKATLNQAENTLEIARRAVSDAVVIAPVDGQISQRAADAGQVVTSATVLLHLVTSSDLYFEPSVPDSNSEAVVIGEPVMIRVDAYPDRTFDGQISKIFPEGSASSRTIPLRVRISNRSHLLRANMFAQGRIVLENHPHVVLAPAQAVVKNGQKNVIYEVDSGSLKIVPVKLGLSSEDGDWIQVEGPKPGAQIVTSDTSGLKEGQKVRVQTEPKEGN